MSIPSYITVSLLAVCAALILVSCLRERKSMKGVKHTNTMTIPLGMSITVPMGECRSITVHAVGASEDEIVVALEWQESDQLMDAATAIDTLEAERDRLTERVHILQRAQADALANDTRLAEERDRLKVALGELVGCARAARSAMASQPRGVLAVNSIAYRLSVAIEAANQALKGEPNESGSGEVRSCGERPCVEPRCGVAH